MKRINKIFRFILSHPIGSKNKMQGIWNFVIWQAKMRMAKEPKVFNWIGGAKLYIRKGMAGATGNIYTGLHEFEDMAFLLHYLRKGDAFFDVGANIGSYSILAASCNKAFVYGFEPVPSTFESLKNNVKLNNAEDLIQIYNVGASDAAGRILFTHSLDTVNHAVVNEKKATEDLIEVKVVKLDSFYPEVHPSLIKIDVEGFEYKVLKGAVKLLGSSELDAVIIELNGSGKHYGYSDEAIHQLLVENGFQPYSYKPFTRELEKISKPKQNENTLYLKESNYLRVRERLEKALPFEALGIKV